MRLAVLFLVGALSACGSSKDRCIDSGGLWNSEKRTCYCETYREDGYCASIEIQRQDGRTLDDAELANPAPLDHVK